MNIPNVHTTLTADTEPLQRAIHEAKTQMAIFADHAALGGELAVFADEQSEWSHATFGTPDQRGPVGPLKHLCKEILVELLGADEEAVDQLLKQASGGLLAEYVRPQPTPHGKLEGWMKIVRELSDVLILFNDAISRMPSPLDWKTLLFEARRKNAENRCRQWPAAKTAGSDSSPVEHDRTEELRRAAAAIVKDLIDNPPEILNRGLRKENS